MIGHRDLHTTAANPNFEMGTLYVRQNSAANVALLDVPRRSGVAITRVWMRVTNCDGETADYDAVRTGTMWVVDVPGTHFATPGEVPGGVDVWASGDGADGEPYAWSIGTGSLCVREGDSGTPMPGNPWTAIKLRETAPTNPAYGDAKIESGALYVWDGTQWVGGGGGGGIVDDTVTRTSSNAVKSSGIWSAIWGKLTSLPTGFTALYDWVVDQLAGKLSKTGGTITGPLVLKGTALQIEDTDTAADMGGMYPVGSPSGGGTVLKLIRWSAGVSQAVVLTAENAATIDYVQGQLAGKLSTTGDTRTVTATDSVGTETYKFAGTGDTDANTVVRVKNLPYINVGEAAEMLVGVYGILARGVQRHTAASGETSATFGFADAPGSGKILDALLDIDNSANSSALGIEFNLLGEDYALAVTDGDDLAEITELAAGERARFYFTETAQRYTPSGAQDSIPVISIQRMTIEVVTTQGGA